MNDDIGRFAEKKLNDPTVRELMERLVEAEKERDEARELHAVICDRFARLQVDYERLRQGEKL